MSEPENFLTRWSRRKQEAEHKADRPHEPPAEERAPQPDAEVPASQTKPADAPQPEFDLSSLPPIEAIDVGTDIRSFLQKGVPLELTRAALRRAWSSDPAIRDFIGIAENQWDFATGSDIPAFGPLEASDDVRRMVAELFQDRFKVLDAEPSLPTNRAAGPEAHLLQSTDNSAVSSEPPAIRSALRPEHQQPSHERLVPGVLPASSDSIVHRTEKDIATQNKSEPTDRNLTSNRSHGRALPR